MSETAVADPLVEEQSQEPIAPPEPDAPVVQEEQEADSDLEGYLKERGLATETPGDGAADGERGEKSWLDKLAPEDRVEAEREIAEARTLREQEQYRRTEGRRVAFQGRTAAINQFLENQGIAAEDRQRVVATFNEHHADSMVFAREEVMEGWVKGLYEAMGSVLPAAEREAMGKKQYASYPDALKAFQESSRKGYVTEKAAKASAAKEITDFKAWLQDAEHPERIDSLRSRSRAPSMNGGTGSGGKVTYAQISKMTPAQVATLPSEVFLAAVNGG